MIALSRRARRRRGRQISEAANDRNPAITAGQIGLTYWTEGVHMATLVRHVIDASKTRGVRTPYELADDRTRALRRS